MIFKINKRTVNLFTAVSAVMLFLNFSVSAQTAKSVEDLVKSISGGKLKVETKAAPYQIVGDFDGDKVKDVAVIVSLSDTPANLAKTVTVQYPYYSGKEVNAEDLALFIIHGKGKGWQFAQKSSILFLGANAALIFEKPRLGEHGDNGYNWELQKDKRGRAKLYFATEGSEGYLKWNGKKYVWSETNP